MGTRNSDPTLALVIGLNAHDARRASNRTLASVAGDTGISESMLCKVEKGLTCPSVPVLVRLARALRVEVKDLFADPLADVAGCA